MRNSTSALWKSLSPITRSIGCNCKRCTLVKEAAVLEGGSWMPIPTVSQSKDCLFTERT